MPFPPDVPNRLAGAIVDRLPAALWRAGNLWLGGRLHFCVDADPDGRCVRTVEWAGRVVASGRREADVPGE